MDMLKSLSLAGLVPVLRIQDAKDAVPLCAALAEGGLPVAEITFRTDAAEEAIRRVHRALPDVLLGAGTVLTTAQADRAVDAGAGYIVSPGLNPAVVSHCVSRGYPVLPGCANPSDIEAALALGLKTVKFFPAEALGGVKLIQAMAAPYGDIRFVPTGGVSEKNLLTYLNCPCVAACGGSWMAPQDAVERGDWPRVTALAQAAVRLMLGLEIRHIGVNNARAEDALEQAGRLSRLLGWPVYDGEGGAFVGEGFEVLKSPGRGEKGHIALAVNDVPRAMWHLQRRGFAFEDKPAGYLPDGRVKAVYLRGDIAGFAFHLLQK